MEEKLLPSRVWLFAAVLLLIFLECSSFAQTTREVAGELLSVGPLDGLSGCRFVSSTVVQSGPRTRESTAEIDIYSPSVFRMKFINSRGKERVYVRDGDFSFSAYVHDGKYRFDVMGFDEKAESSVRSSVRNANHLIGNCHSFFGASWKEFFKDDRVSIVSVEEIESPNGLAQKIAIEIPSDGGRGEFVWLPEHDYMLESAYFEFPDEPSVTYSMTNTFEFREGRLIPVRSEIFNPDGEFITSLDSFGDCNPDRDFYTAESLGLETPPRPWPYTLLWLIAGSCLLVMGVMALRRLGGRNR